MFNCSLSYVSFLTPFSIGTLFSLGGGVLQPLVLIVMGDMLNTFGDNSYFFDKTPTELPQYLKVFFSIVFCLCSGFVFIVY